MIETSTRSVRTAGVRREQQRGRGVGVGVKPLKGVTGTGEQPTWLWAQQEEVDNPGGEEQQQLRKGELRFRRQKMPSRSGGKG